MSKLPTWAGYLITAMGIVIMSLSTMTFIKVDKTLTKFESFMTNQTEYNAEMKQFKTDICRDLMLNHTQRMEKYKIFSPLHKN